MSEPEMRAVVSALERIGKLLAVAYAHNLGEAEPRVKAEHLSRCGFSNTEIAALLGTTPNNVNVLLHRARRQMKGSMSLKGKAKR